MDGERNKALGEFLRARRALVRPEQVGLPAGAHRRVPGLRRDEVALLAGLSPGYYARLEQGHQRPTHETVECLGRALRLDAGSAVELHRLTRSASPRRSRGHGERVGTDVATLLAAWTTAPAYVLGRHGDVLARNPLATALHSPFTHTGNLPRMVFLDPAARRFFRDWPATARHAVHVLRRTAENGTGHRELRDLVGELTLAGPEFARLWAEARNTPVPSGRFVHPDVGELDLRTEVFEITSAPGQRLVAHPAEPGSRGEEALTLLSTLVAC
ncbi:Helix-turn-helix domain-containing protein [Lentzea fradiae]|uniref:Helix-turn-helix domain-containing protein n=1 Tax=Lentzea fradiae TaxID=200378 RepID=A0A1G7KUI2_9PSEU|nr:helix-turn-helix transcriptional regulator [Lentzea fradiae]SDF40897.1 Helix-turn-helix domain-containing protein [Lentzea fradiae]